MLLRQVGEIENVLLEGGVVDQKETANRGGLKRTGAAGCLAVLPRSAVSVNSTDRGNSNHCFDMSRYIALNGTVRNVVGRLKALCCLQPIFLSLRFHW